MEELGLEPKALANGQKLLRRVHSLLAEHGADALLRASMLMVQAPPLDLAAAFLIGALSHATVDELKEKARRDRGEAGA